MPVSKSDEGDLYNQLREDLLAAQFFEDSLIFNLSEPGLEQARQGLKSLALAKLQESSAESALKGLLQLFVIGTVVSRAQAQDIFQRLGVAGAERLGLILSDAEGFRAGLNLSPNTRRLIRDGTAKSVAENTLWILSDLDDHLREGEVRLDHVMGVGGATRSLLDAIPLKVYEKVLDLGTGNGIVGLELASISRNVVVSDISSRALYFARANALLNNVANITFVQSDLFAELSDENFDLIASNPPFVLSPESLSSYEYRSAGKDQLDLLERITQESVARLSANGIFVSLGNWVAGADPQNFVSPVTAALSWVIDRGSQSAVQYARTWLRDAGFLEGSEQFQDYFHDWVRFFNEAGINRISYGYILVQKSEVGRGVRRYEAIAGALNLRERFGDNWNAVLRDLNDYETLKISGLEDFTFECAPEVFDVRTYRPGTEDILALNLVSQQGIDRMYQAGTLTSAFVGVSDGEMSYLTVVHALAEILELDFQSVKEELDREIPELILSGMIRLKDIKL